MSNHLKSIVLSVALFFLAIITKPLVAQNMSSMGTDFWLTFMDNADTTRGSYTLSVFATSKRPCVLTVTNPNTGWTNSINVDPMATNRMYIPLSEAYTTQSGVITSTGLHAFSTDTISLYTITEGYPNLDYANVLPTRVLGSEYLIQSYPSDRYSSEFVFIAVEDSVNVTVNLKGRTIDGIADGTTLSYFLPHAGDACQIKSSLPGDLSGTTLKALNHKRIAVFNGNACVYIPDYPNGLSCDHIVEQAMPTFCLGRRFIVSASRSDRPDFVRITSSVDNCLIKVNNATVANINRSDTYQYRMSSNTAVDYIETSQPSVVYLYFPSLNGIAPGDPAMTTIMPLEQCFPSITFPVLSTGHINAHHLSVVCDTQVVRSIFLDGTSLSPLFHTVPSNPAYAYSRMTIPVNSHSLVDTSGVGFLAFLYGFGSRESYGYPLGFAGKNLSPHSDLYANGQMITYSNDEVSICVGDTVRFQTQSNGIIDSVFWDFGEGYLRAADSVTRRYDSVGDFPMCVIVCMTDTSYYGLYHADTICATVHVYPSYFAEIYDTCVENVLPFRFGGNAYNADVENDTLVFHTRAGCDSVKVFNLKVWYNDTAVYDTTVCDTLLPFSWHGASFQFDSTAVVRLLDVHGADSVLVLNLSTTICRRSHEPRDTGDINDPAIWVPNVFTPNLQGENNRFRIFCNQDILSAKVEIFNRWGEKICRFDGLKESWDGKYNGIPCQQGTYVYKIAYTTTDTPYSENILFGSITLVR